MKRLFQQLGFFLLVLLWSYSVRAADVALMPVSVELDRANDRATVQLMHDGREPLLMQAEAIA